MGSLREEGICCLSRGGHPGTLVRVSGKCCPCPGFPYAVMEKVVGLGFPHADIVRQRYFCLMKVVNCDEF